ncbi:MAG: hypothetical protein JXJ17_04360 [Anaerolineae bacterium]|nr:hypothetical protein [Anaerolineae bacterium]
MDQQDGKIATATVRIGFLAAGLYLLTVGGVFGQHPQALWSIFPIVSSFLMYGIGFLLLGMGLLRRNPIRCQWMILASILLSFSLQFVSRLMLTAPGEMGTDSALFSGYAVDLLLRGENPYTHDMSAAYHVYRVTNFFMTPLLDGGASTRLPYPALHFLILVPLKLVGVHDVRIVYALAVAATAVLLYRYAPHSLRGMALIPLYMNAAYLDHALGWVSDGMWMLLLVAMVICWNRPTGRAVLFGLACAYKQSPWGLAPFLVLRLLLDDQDADQRPPFLRMLYFAGVAGGVFLLINGPFMLLDFPAWWAGIFEPLRASMIPFGTGFSTLTQSGIALFPKGFYSLATLLVLVSLLLLYGLYFRRLKHTLWFLPGVVLWFSYRSLQSYFIYWVPLLIAAVIALIGETESENAKEADRQWWPALAVGGGSALILAGLMIVFTRTATPLIVELVDLSANADLYAIDKMEISITNPTDQTVEPRISVQQVGWQPYPWQIESGAERLEPGESSVYWISTDLPYRTFALADGAQVVVSDASGDYRLRGSLVLDRDLSLLDPGTIYNAAYLPGPYRNGVPFGWAFDDDLPTAWLMTGADAESGFRTARMGFAAQAGVDDWQSVGLRQTILYPAGDIFVWVYPPADDDLAYGIAFDDGEHSLWVLFGGDALEGNQTVVVQDAPRDEWSLQRINLEALYGELGWLLPAYEPFNIGELELITQTVDLRLFVAGRDFEESRGVEGRFGPIWIEGAADAIDQRADDLVENEWAYYLALSGAAANRRNVEQAGALYAAAVHLAGDKNTPLIDIEAISEIVEPGDILLVGQPEMAYLRLMQSKGSLPGVELLNHQQVYDDQLQALTEQGIPQEAAERFAARDLAEVIVVRLDQGAVYSLSDDELLREYFDLDPVGDLYRVSAR